MNKDNSTIKLIAIWRELNENDRNNIRQYREYRKGEIILSDDEANSLLMEIICELTDLILETEYNIPRDEMYDENGSFYEEYQDRFNDLYDDMEDKILSHDFNNKK